MKTSFGESFDDNNSGNWNVAGQYSQLKIMRHLFAIDQYILMSRFGAIEFFEELNLNQNQINVMKINGIKRLHNHLIMLISNTLFAIKGKKEDKETLINQKKLLINIKPLINSSYEEIYSEKTKIVQFKIKENIFEDILNKLCLISEEINEPLNRSDLIFLGTENIDPFEVKKIIKNTLQTEA